MILNITHLNVAVSSGDSLIPAHLKIYGEAEYKMTECRAGIFLDHHKLQKTRKKEKHVSKKDMIQPYEAKMKKTLVRRSSINSGTPNFSHEDGGLRTQWLLSNILQCFIFLIIYYVYIHNISYVKLCNINIKHLVKTGSVAVNNMKDEHVRVDGLQWF